MAVSSQKDCLDYWMKWPRLHHNLAEGFLFYFCHYHHLHLKEELSFIFKPKEKMSDFWKLKTLCAFHTWGNVSGSFAALTLISHGRSVITIGRGQIIGMRNDVTQRTIATGWSNLPTKIPKRLNLFLLLVRAAPWPYSGISKIQNNNRNHALKTTCNRILDERPAE